MRVIYFWLLSLLLSCFLVVSEASAAYYTWYASYYGITSSSPGAVCDQIDGVNGYLTGWTYTGTTQTQAQCLSTSTGNPVSNTNMVRSGTGCQPGYTYNETTGGCEVPVDSCSVNAGTTIDHQHRIGDLGATGAHSEPPTSICNGSCQYSFDFHTNDCYRYVDGSNLNSAFCSYRYKANGTSCTESTHQPPSKPPAPSRDADSSCGAWTSNGDGTATRDCSSTDTYKDPGSMNCGSSAGTVSCTSGNPPPAYTDKQTDQHTVKADSPDGSSSTTTTTTTTTTGCYGTKPCSTSETTTTDTSNSNPDGTPGHSQSSCTGDKCAGGSDDDDDPSKDPEEEEEEGPERLATVGECDAPVSCEGDAIDCAILQEQNALKCEVIKQGDFDAHKTDIESMFQGEQFELETSDIQAPSFINSGTRFLPASCPPPETITLTSNGGHTFAFKYEPLCSFASDFSFLIVTMMGIWCAVYVGRAFGGE